MVQDKISKSFMNKRLFLSNLQWQYVFDISNDPIFILDSEYRILECNEKAEEVYGYKKEEFIELSLDDIRAPYTREEIENAMQRSVDENGIVFETRHRKKNGDEFYVEVSTKSFEVEGELIYIHSVRDIGRKKNAEENLRFSEERYRKLVNFAPVAIFLICNEKILYSNPAALRLLGADNAGQVIGMQLPDFIHPDFREITYKRVSSLKEGMAPSQLEQKIINLRDEVIDVEVFAKPVRYKSLPTVEIFMHDITIRKKAEVYSSFLAAVVETSKNPIIVCSLDGSIIYWNKSAESSYGYTSDEISNKLLFKILAAGSQDTIMVLMEKVKAGKFTGNHRISMKKKNGEILNVYLTMSPIIGSNGEAAGISIITQTINDVQDETDLDVY